MTTLARSRVAVAALLVPLAVGALAGCGGPAAPAAPAAPATAPSPPAPALSCARSTSSPPLTRGPGREPAPAAVTTFAAKIGPLVEQAKTGAPADLAPALDKMAQLVDSMRTTGKMPDFSDPAVSGAINGSEAWAHTNCAFQNVDVTAVGAKFEGLPSPHEACLAPAVAGIRSAAAEHGVESPEFAELVRLTAGLNGDS
ncbi:hypothetical protein ACQEVB_40630 [Pseudonocardia sp. CA-107938]|uniref:hypothetical protein n=1 Tax=Pseudonocardia sp. CA-107938 TaxID=3240021 RepID=UPI003D8F6E24